MLVIFIHFFCMHLFIPCIKKSYVDPMLCRSKCNNGNYGKDGQRAFIEQRKIAGAFHGDSRGFVEVLLECSMAFQPEIQSLPDIDPPAVIVTVVQHPEVN